MTRAPFTSDAHHVPAPREGGDSGRRSRAGEKGLKAAARCGWPCRAGAPVFRRRGRAIGALCSTAYWALSLLCIFLLPLFLPFGQVTSHSRSTRRSLHFYSTLGHLPCRAPGSCPRPPAALCPGASGADPSARLQLEVRGARGPATSHPHSLKQDPGSRQAPPSHPLACSPGSVSCSPCILWARLGRQQHRSPRFLGRCDTWSALVPPGHLSEIPVWTRPLFPGGTAEETTIRQICL